MRLPAMVFCVLLAACADTTGTGATIDGTVTMNLLPGPIDRNATFKVVVTNRTEGPIEFGPIACEGLLQRRERDTWVPVIRTIQCPLPLFRISSGGSFVDRIDAPEAAGHYRFVGSVRAAETRAGIPVVSPEFDVR